jgi:hypothetical protein
VTGIPGLSFVGRLKVKDLRRGDIVDIPRTVNPRRAGYAVVIRNWNDTTAPRRRVLLLQEFGTESPVAFTVHAWRTEKLMVFVPAASEC